jgi:transposase
LVRRDALEARSRARAQLAAGAHRRKVALPVRHRHLSAVGLCAEIGDFERFEHAGQLMSYLGVVLSEDSSGERRRQGAITKSARATPAGCSSKRRGTTAAYRRKAKRSAAAKKTSHRR